MSKELEDIGIYDLDDEPENEVREAKRVSERNILISIRSMGVYGLRMIYDKEYDSIPYIINSFQKKRRDIQKMGNPKLLRAVKDEIDKIEEAVEKLMDEEWK